MEVTNIPQTKTYELTKEENVPIIRNWLGWEGLQLIKPFMNTEKEAHKMAIGLISMMSKKFKWYHNQIVLLIQYCKLKRKSHKSAQERMGRLCTKASRCEYHDYDRRLTEQFIHVLDDKVTICKILRKLRDTKGYQWGLQQQKY